MTKIITICLMITILAGLITTCLFFEQKYNSKVVRMVEQKDTSPINNQQELNTPKPSSNNLYQLYHQNVDDGLLSMKSTTYDENPIEIKEFIHKDENLDCHYLQISGLKDKKVENKINQELKETIIAKTNSTYAKYFDMKTKDPDTYIWYFKEGNRLVGTQSVLANFSNVLCIDNSVNWRI